jgi:hypothetical protein
LASQRKEIRAAIVSIVHELQDELAGIERTDRPMAKHRTFAIVLALIKHLVLAQVLLDHDHLPVRIARAPEDKSAHAVVAVAGNGAFTETQYDVVHGLLTECSLLPISPPEALA